MTKRTIKRQLRNIEHRREAAFKDALASMGAAWLLKTGLDPLMAELVTEELEDVNGRRATRFYFRERQAADILSEASRQADADGAAAADQRADAAIEGAGT